MPVEGGGGIAVAIKRDHLPLRASPVDRPYGGGDIHAIAEHARNVLLGAALRDAGVILAESNAQAVRLAATVVLGPASVWGMP